MQPANTIARDPKSFYARKPSYSRFTVSSIREKAHVKNTIDTFDNSDHDEGSDDDDVVIPTLTNNAGPSSAEDQQPGGEYTESEESDASSDEEEGGDEDEDEGGDEEDEERGDEDEKGGDKDEEEDESGEEEDEDKEWEEVEEDVDVDEDKEDEEDEGTNGQAQTNHRWRKRGTPAQPILYLGDPFPDPREEDISTYGYFKMFFDDDLIENIVEQTNIYSMQQSGTSIATNIDEIEKYIGIIMTMSYVKLPTQRMYWTNRFRIPSIANLMTAKHFEKLKRCIHFNNNDDALPKSHNEFDKLFKIRPLIDSVLPKCQAIPTEEHHSIDEQIIPTKGRSGLRQYLPKKPNKWGIKVWARCGHSDILYDFEIYEGRKDKRDVNEIPGLLMGGGGGGMLCTA